MGRKKDPQTGYRLQEHRINGYVYATTQRTAPGKNGTPVRRHVHWGRVDGVRSSPTPPTARRRPC